MTLNAFITPRLPAAIAAFVACALLAGCAKAPTTDTAEAVMLEAFKEAHLAKDPEKFKALLDVDSATPAEILEMTVESFMDDTPLTISSLEIKPPVGDEVTSFELNGITYTVSLPLSKILHVSFSPEGQGEFSTLNTTYFLGVKDGRLLIPTPRAA